jgi:hypothetical protein
MRRIVASGGDTRGIKAKTVYPPMPPSWPASECAEPDKVFAQIQADVLNAKSIGWLPTTAHFADAEEALPPSGPPTSVSRRRCCFH